MPVLLLGCSASQDPLEPDAPGDAVQDAVVDTFVAARPEPLLDLVYDLDTFFPHLGDCPRLVESDESGLERWEGGCWLPGGARVEGHLERLDGDRTAWVGGEAFRVFDPRAEETLFYLDGAVEVFPVGELLLAEAAVSICGGPTVACEPGEPPPGLVVMDLAYTLYPRHGFPERYDLTISGVVAAPQEPPASISGTWTVDTATCQEEPVNGSVYIGSDRAAFLDFDGAESCDACAYSTVDSYGSVPTCAHWQP